MTEHYNTESLDGIYIERATFNQLKDAGPGAFAYRYDEDGKIIGLLHWLPGAGYGYLPFRKGPRDPDKSGWKWDGNLERPTLTPSIDAKPALPYKGYAGRPGWHGFLKDGRWESC